MNNFFRTLIAGYGATKLGGGCLSTIIIFILIYVALGQCNKQAVHTTLNSKNPAFVTSGKHQGRERSIPTDIRIGSRYFQESGRQY